MSDRSARYNLGAEEMLIMLDQNVLWLIEDARTQGGVEDQSFFV